MRTTLSNSVRKTVLISILSLFATTTTTALDVVAANNDATEILPTSTIEAMGSSFKVLERSITTGAALQKTIENRNLSGVETVYEALELVARLKTSYDVGDVDCYGGNNGYATVYVSGGTEPYTYEWSHGATTQTIDNLVAGMYRLVIRDADGNRANCRVRIKEPSRLTHNITKLSDASAYGASDGSARVRVNGGTRPYTYAWDNGETTDTAYSLDAGNHRVDITDANGCTTVCYIQINEPEPEPEDCKVAGDDCAITVCEGTQPSEQQLFDALLGEDAGGIWSGPVNGVYTYTIAAAGTCPEDSATVTVTEEDALSAGVSTDLALCDSDDDPTMAELLALLGGDAGGTWSPGAYAGAGDYIYTIAATATCAASSATVMVTITDKPDTEVTNASICPGESFEWKVADGGNGITYDAAVDITIPGENCAADQQLILTITDKPATEVTTETACSDPGYYWDVTDTTYTTSQDITIPGENCAADQQLILTITDKPATEVTTETACSDPGYYWDVTDTTYTTSQDITIPGENCAADQQLILTITDKPATEVTTETACSDPGYYWDVTDTTYTTSQDITIPGENCAADQQLILTITDKPATEVTTETACSDPGYYWDVTDTTYTTSQDITIPGENCAADQQLILTITDKPATEVTTETACSDPGYYWDVTDTTYTTSQDITIPGENCAADQQLILTITDKPATEVTTETACSDPGYYWDVTDTTYTTSQDITIPGENCAADQQLILTITDKPATEVTTETACSDPGYYWDVTDTTYTTSQDITIPGENCAADQQLILTITDKPATEVTTETACSDPGYYWDVTDTTYTTSQDITIPGENCAADQQLILTITDKPATEVTTETACSDPGYYWDVTDTTYTTSQDITIPGENCAADQQLILTITDKPATEVTTETACSDPGYYWDVTDTTYTTSQDITIPGENCAADQQLILTITDKPATEVTTETACSDPGYYWDVTDTTYTTSQDITIPGENCAADQQLILTITDKPATEVTTETACSDPGYYWDVTDTTYTTSQDITIPGENCTADQQLILTITDKPATAVTTETACSDPGYYWDVTDTTYTTSQDITIPGENCAADQQLILTITDKPATAVTTETACSDPGYYWDVTDTTYTTSQDITIPGENCTADQQLILTITDKPATEVTTETACSDPGYYWDVTDTTYTTSQDITIPGENCTADQQLILTITDKPATAVTTETACSDPGYYWDVTDTTYTTSQDITIPGENCTADQQLILTITDKPATAVTTETACSDPGYYWDVTDTTYTTSQDITIPGENCTADQQLILTITDKPDTVVTEETICEDEDYTWEVADGGNGETYDIDDAVNGIVDITVEGDNCAADQQLIVTIEDCTEPPAGCETAFARYDEGGDEDLIDETNDGRCFLDDGFNRWGWTNLFSAPGSYNLQLYSGAGQCGFANRQSGIVTVDWEGSSNMVTVRIDLLPGFEMQQAHLYVGGNDYPTVQQGPNTSETVAPGKYPYQDGEGGNPEITTPVTSYTFSPVDVSGLDEIYVIVHAVTCEVEICKSAGENGTLTICEGDNPNPTDEQLFAELSGADAGGTWTSNDAIYTYTIAATDNCPEVSSTVTVTYEDCIPCDFLAQLGQDLDGNSTNDQWGRSVSFSADGSRVAIGAPYDRLANGPPFNTSFEGEVEVWTWNGSIWVQLGNTIDGVESGEQSGWSVSLSADGSRVAIGAPGNDGNGINSGLVRVFRLVGNIWTQQGADILGEALGDGSGASVSMSANGSRVAIGAISNDGNGSSSGHVRVYGWNGTTWVQTGADIDGEAAGDFLGYSVSLSADGSRVAIGAPLNDGNGSSSGHVRVYDWNGTAWTQAGADIDGEAAGDNSGYSVSLSADGSRVAIGGYRNAGINGNDSGHVRAYDWNGSAWIQAGADIDGEAAGDNSGWSVSLSADGSRVAIGARNNDGNGNGSGHVRLYAYNGSSWAQQGSDIDGEAAGDQSGLSVSLNADGSRVAIGAPNNTRLTGQVRVYGCEQAEEEDSTVERQSTASTLTVFKEPSSAVLSVDLDISYDARVNTNFQNMSGRTVLTAPASQVSAGTNRLEYNMGIVPSQVLIINVYTGREIISKKVLWNR